MDQDQDQQLVQRITKLVMASLQEQNDKARQSESHSGLGLVTIGVSARHVHLCRAHVDILFGKDYALKQKKMLMGGQYACEECVTIVGLKLRAIENVRILGPERKATQVEVSQTDAIKLGIDPPVRDSGDIKGSTPIAIVGPKGAIFLDEGCMIARRHIHMSPEDALHFGVNDRQVVSVELRTERGGLLRDVLVRVDPTFTLEMHVDTDEANAMGILCNDKARIRLD